MSVLSVAEYIVYRLSALGIEKAFGVPGDFSFPIDDAIEKSKKMSWVLCTNELNAAYAADGYARRKGCAFLTVTYGVGCLSALNGLMGSKAHRLPIFLVAGSPSERITTQKLITHHTVGNGNYHDFDSIIEKACCASAVLKPDNVIQELERLIYMAFRESRPVYISVPSDAGLMPMIGRPVRFSRPVFSSIQNELENAVAAIQQCWKSAKRPVGILSTLIQRYGQQAQTLKLIRRLGLPFAVMPNDKGVVDEGHAQFMGIYAGQFSVPAALKECIENSDCILDIGGVVLEQFSTGFFSCNLPINKHIIIRPHQVQIGDKVFTNVFIGDVINQLFKKLRPVTSSTDIESFKQLPMVGKPQENLALPSVLCRLQTFLREDDILVAESGSSTMMAASTRMPDGVGFESQFLWGSIGWATPAAFGMCLAEPKKRVVLLTGDGAHQMTLLELINMGRHKTKPIIFVLDNQSYAAEYRIHAQRMKYNKLVSIDYAALPEIFKCKNWLSQKVQTVAEFDAVLEKLERHHEGAYIQLLLSEDEAKSLPAELIDQAYKLKTP